MEITYNHSTTLIFTFFFLLISSLGSRFESRAAIYLHSKVEKWNCIFYYFLTLPVFMLSSLKLSLVIFWMSSFIFSIYKYFFSMDFYSEIFILQSPIPTNLMRVLGDSSGIQSFLITISALSLFIGMLSSLKSQFCIYLEEWEEELNAELKRIEAYEESGIKEVK